MDNLALTVEASWWVRWLCLLSHSKFIVSLYKRPQLLSVAFSTRLPSLAPESAPFLAPPPTQALGSNGFPLLLAMGYVLVLVRSPKRCTLINGHHFVKLSSVNQFEYAICFLMGPWLILMEQVLRQSFIYLLVHIHNTKNGEKVNSRTSHIFLYHILWTTGDNILCKEVSWVLKTNCVLT